MKKTTLFIILAILFVLGTKISFSQKAENWLEKNDPISYAKLYLHTDRDIYFQGDSIWFKAYYLNGQTQNPIPGFFNLFVDFIDNNGKTIQCQVLPILEGFTSGNIKIPDLSEQGSYVLRAFTESQKNYGEDAFFHKILSVKKVKNIEKVETEMTSPILAKKPKIDLAFLPEGGFLLADKRNIVGVKAIDENGRGILIEGEIVDSKGKKVSVFVTQYNGMGKVYFSPIEGENYHVELKGYPEFEYEFSNVKNAGIKLEFAGKIQDDLVFQVISNSKAFQGKDYYFAIMHHGAVLYYQKFVQKNSNSQIRINESELAGGINRLILLDEELNPISERLYFSKNYEINNVQISSDQSQYKTRSNVQLDIFDSDEKTEQSYSNLSIAVVDKNAVGINGPTTNILSWLLIDSELKGSIESPSDYFIDEEDHSSENKLNLLMLTHGWRNYLWNNLVEKEIHEDFKPDEGIEVKGWVKRVLSKKPIVDGNVVLGLLKDGYISAFETKTDSNGRFSFDNLMFNDTAQVFVQARNDKGNLLTIVFLDSVFGKNPDISKAYLPKSKEAFDLSSQLYRQKYNSLLAMHEYDPQSNAIMLDEVIVNAAKIKKEDAHFRTYPKPFNSLEVKEQDYSYRNVFEFLVGRVAGVQVWGDKITIRVPGSINSGTTPLILVDGMATQMEDAMNIPISIIDKVEVLKTIGETAIFGVRGGNGVISILLKKYKYSEEINPYTKGAISSTIVGYAGYREFYSPKYTSENIDSKRPDNRVTLYWNPDIITKNGKASLSFFTSDDLANYKIFVEGITNDGRVCIGSAEFAVNEYNENSSKK